MLLSPAFGKDTQIVVRLKEAKYGSGDKEGLYLDLQNICIVSFWGNGLGTVIVDDMYLTNNNDYSREEKPDAIRIMDDSPATVDVYSINGVCVRQVVSQAQALKNLPAGIYIIGGKKFVVR